MRCLDLDARCFLRTTFFTSLFLTPVRLPEDDFLDGREVTLDVFLTRLLFFFFAEDLAVLLPDLDDAGNAKAICLIDE